MSQETKISNHWIYLLTDGPYSKPLLFEKLMYFEFLLRKGDEVVLFLYQDAIHIGNSNQFPKNMLNIGAKLIELKEKYSLFQVKACSRCTAARGYLDLSKSNLDNDLFVSTKLLDFVQVTSVREFGRFVQKGYRVLQ
jgi:sulfur relay (sulfurtransferase) complex TusBCD TusD component (DsrE family)